MGTETIIHWKAWAGIGGSQEIWREDVGCYPNGWIGGTHDSNGWPLIPTSAHEKQT